MIEKDIKPKFATVREISQLFPSFSESSLRYWIFHSRSNGLDVCLRKIGKKILINIAEFEGWINRHTDKKLRASNEEARK